MVDDLNVGSRVQSKLIKGLAAVEPVGLAIIVNTQHVHKLWMRVLIARRDVEHPLAFFLNSHGFLLCEKSGAHLPHGEVVPGGLEFPSRAAWRLIAVLR